ncbi:hypothetical protein [Calidifontibacter indicus]
MPVVADYIAVTAICWLVVLAGVLIATTGQWIADTTTPKGDR